MKLEVPFFRQEKSMSCGLATLRMILGYYGFNIREKDLARGIKSHSFGTFLTDLGIIALQQGFKVEIYSFHLSLLSPLKIAFGAKVTEAILAKVKPRPSDKMTLDSWKNILKLAVNLFGTFLKLNSWSFS